MVKKDYQRSMNILRPKLIKCAVMMAVAMGFFGSWPQALHAYVPSPDHVLELMLDSIGKVKRIKASRKIMIIDADLPQGQAVFMETLKIHRPGRLRMEIQGPHSEKIFVQDNTQFVTVLDGKYEVTGNMLFDRHLEWLLPLSRPQLQMQLEAAGLNLQQSRLERWQKKVAVVIGAPPGQSAITELWVDKDDFVPLRWRFMAPPNLQKTQSAGDNLEIRYLQWETHKKFKFPKRIEIFQNDKLIERIDTVSVAVGTGFSADLFDIELIKSLYPPTRETSPMLPSDRPLEEVRETIEQFKRRYN